MKKNIIYIFIALLLIGGCRKEDNPRIPKLDRVPLPLITVDKTGDQVISQSDPDAFVGKFIVGLYYPDDVKPTKFDVVVIKNGNTAVVKTVQADVTTFPATVSLTGVAIKALFGVSSVLGDSYTIGVNIFANGKVYPAFSALGETSNGGIPALAGTSTTIQYAAVCKFNMADFGAVGASVPFLVVKDGWADYAAGQTVSLKIIDATHISFIYGADNPQPIVIAVDPTGNTTSVAKVTYGNYGAETFTATSVANHADNFVAPCDLTFSVRLAHNGSINGAYGSYTISFKKK